MKALLAGLLLLASAPANEPARPLTDRGLDNLVAFTRLLGARRGLAEGRDEVLEKGLEVVGG